MIEGAPVTRRSAFGAQDQALARRSAPGLERLEIIAEAAGRGLWGQGARRDATSGRAADPSAMAGVTAVADQP